MRLAKALRICEHCGTEFKPWRKDSRFCKRACSNAANGSDTTAAGAKQCRSCLLVLPKQAFPRPSKTDRSAHDDVCQSCRTKEIVKRRESRPWYFRLVASLLCNARRRARESGIPFDLVRADIVVPDFCPVFGTPFRLPKRKRGYFSQSQGPSIDRIVPALGYVKTNIVVVSCRANSLKGDATPEELIRLSAFYSRYGA
jgi:hypothetical protein